MDDLYYEDSDNYDYLPSDNDEQYIQEIIEGYEKGIISAEEIEELLQYADQTPVPMSLGGLAEQCVIPTLTQTLDSLLPLLLLCFAYRCVAYILHNNDNGTRYNHGDSPSITNLIQDANLSDNLLEICDCALGFVAMHFILGPETLILVIYSMTAFVVMVLVREHGFHVGISVSLFTVLFIVSCELYLLLQEEWHKIRGSQMIMSMKVISLAFDLENGVVPIAPNFWTFGSYIFHVGTSIFGPWISYQEHHSRIMTSLPFLDTTFLKKVVTNLMLSISSLLLSMCFISWVVDDDNYKWIVAYRDAQSFRFSHYFVSYMSQLTVILSTYSLTHGDVAVTRPMVIEFPRSLVDVVINWNIPMHTWLKTYVFKNARYLGTFPAIILTYVASSLLHGLNFQLSAVLLTLGFYTYVEYILRNKLSTIFNACVQARACKNDCCHLYKHGNTWVILTNLVLAALSVFHLAYLGLMFDSTNNAEQGYTMWHTLEKWSNLGYLSHIVAAVTYAFYVII